MKVLSVILGVFIVLPSFAQSVSVEDDSINLAREINLKSRSLSQDQRSQIAEKFKNIRDILYGTNSNHDYVCVSRDNDGRNPYMLAVRDGVNVKRIPGSLFQTVDQCQKSLNGIRVVNTGAFVCITRDSDGRSPWQLGLLDTQGGLKKVMGSITNNQEECSTLISKMVYNNSTEIALFCASRDNDARAPFAAISVELKSSRNKHGSETFETLQACWNFLGNPIRR